MKEETDEERKIALYSKYSDNKDKEEARLARENGTLVDYENSGLSMLALLDSHIAKNKDKPISKYKFNLPDELAEKLKLEMIRN